MRPYTDHVLCLLPFEPAALARLKGPEGTYVGHPLVERIPLMRPQNPAESAARDSLERPTVLLLPGSRMSELRRLIPLLLAAKEIAQPPGQMIRWVIPTLPHLVDTIRSALGGHNAGIEIVATPEEKLAAMRQARAALAASGTVTLELALAGIPMVTTYKVANWEAAIARRLIKTPSAILPSIILGESVVPEFIQQDATPAELLVRRLARFCAIRRNFRASALLLSSLKP